MKIDKKNGLREYFGGTIFRHCFTRVEILEYLKHAKCVEEINFESFKMSQFLKTDLKYCRLMFFGFNAALYFDIQFSRIQVKIIRPFS